MSLQDIIEPKEVEEVLVSHLKENNKIYREGPQPWTIRFSPLNGRGMFATRDIEQNELIFVDVPILIGPRCTTKHLQLCVCCYKNECPLFPCDRGCGLPVCSTRCENSPKHVNYECKYLRSLVPTCGTDWSPSLLMTVTAVRALFMTEQQRKCLATLQRDQSLIYNYEMYVSAAFPIAAGEEITMTYTTLFWDTTLRRQFLSVTKHFSCMCKRCSDPTEFRSRLAALLCASDKCSGELLPQDPLNMTTPWICDKCATIISHQQICSIRSGIAAIVEEVLHKTPREIYRFLQKEFSLLVPWSNYLIVDLKFRIISYYGRNDGEKWEDLTDTELDLKIKFCNELLCLLDTLNCGDCRKRGLILYELYCTNLEKIKRCKSNIEKIDENQCLFKKAIAILQNDAVSEIALKYDKNYFKQLITV
ncbi:SET domain-containing protein SmydA-8-like isoform X2 [Frieseomelitta varia]|uniref:SET domain-containing protein SmydA-8-like isoform X2 n=1 Tax=Frieseomelitta varia TaxID=561572 RepID=UPI001CB6A572|nr:SET domain-containing protein SmydA-8-like isoform X2 [Frieseomelitta varia]